MRGHRYDKASWLDERLGNKDKFQWLGEDIGEVKYKYDYDKLGLDESLLSQLTGLFSALGTGSQRESGTQFGMWEEDPDVYEEEVEQYGVDPMAEGTGTEGRFNFRDYANIFDKNQYAKILEMITGNEIDPSMLPQFTGKDIAQTKSQYYTPIEVGARENLLDSIIGGIEGVGTGGFAGSGSRTKGIGGVRRSYKDEMEKVWADISQRRMGGIESLSKKFSDVYDITRG